MVTDNFPASSISKIKVFNGPDQTALWWLQAACTRPIHMGITDWAPEATVEPLQQWESLAHKGTPFGPDFHIGVVLLCHSIHSDGQSKWSGTALFPLKWPSILGQPLPASEGSWGRVSAYPREILARAVSDQLPKEWSFWSLLARLNMPFLNNWIYCVRRSCYTFSEWIQTFPPWSTSRKQKSHLHSTQNTILHFAIWQCAFLPTSHT